MLPHAPPPPPPPESPRAAPVASPQKQITTISLNQAVISEQPIKQHIPLLNNRKTDPEKHRKLPIIQQTRPRRTNPIIWCGAVLCLIFSLILIFLGVATLIIFLVVKPRNPLFDTPNASLNAIYFDSPEYVNGDFTFLANFSNPNRKLDVRFEHLDIELFFSDRLIATQAIQPFAQRRGETRLVSVHFISSLVYLPQNSGVELKKQVTNNRIVYNIRGAFRVRASLGLIHYSYWLHSRCQLQMTGPPTGILVARSCKTKR